MRARKRAVWAVALLSIILPVVSFSHSALAVERWPPWQTLGEAEAAAQARLKRLAGQQGDIEALNRKVAALRAEGKLAEATPLAERALRLTEKKNGPNHPATAAALTTYAELLIAQKRYADAEPLLKRALAIREKAKDTGATAQALNNLAELYSAQGRTGDAKALQDRSAALGSAGKKPVDARKAKAAAPPVVATAPPPPAGTSEMAREKSAAVPRETVAPPPPPPPQAEAKKIIRPLVVKPDARALPGSPAAPPAQAMRREVSPESGGGQMPEQSVRSEPFPGSSGQGAPAPQRSAPRTFGAAPPEEHAAAKPPPPPGPDLSAPSGGGVRAAPPPPAAAAAGPDAKWDVVPVFYGTDRAEEPNPKRVSYNADRGRRLELGEALVTVPKIHEVPQVERPWAIRIPYFDVTIYEQAEDPNKHFTMQQIRKLNKGDFLELVRKRLETSARFKDQAFVFVHGYNTSFDNAVYRTAQIAYDLKFDGAPFLYSWPSGGAVASYTYDRESAEASKAYMRQFLEMVVKESGAKSISIIGHSMGNLPLLDVLKDMKNAAPEGVVISQVIFAAPDVDADTFTDLAQAINGFAKGVTLYAASNDRALMVSRNFWGYFRAGDVPADGPLVIPGIDTIDVTAVSTDTFALNHSDYAQHNQLLNDIAELIATGLRPPEQRALKPERVTTKKGDYYWRYQAPPTGSTP